VSDSSPFVFLDGAARPYLAFRGWLHYWHAANWVALRELEVGEREAFETRKLPSDQAALYGWPCVASDTREAQEVPGE